MASKLSRTYSNVKRNLSVRARQAEDYYRYNLAKNGLPKIEVQIVDQCNLNCRGCSHFCGIADRVFYDLSQFEKDMNRLSRLFKKINKIKLLGGEPLLHPELISFIRIARDYFPLSDIVVVTNGILLPKVEPVFWLVCKETNTAIEMSVYPPLRNKVSYYRELAKQNGVAFKSSKIKWFFTARINPEGDSDMKKAFNACRNNYFVPFLKDGALYSCAISYAVRYYNKRFDKNIVESAGLDIYKSTSREIIDYLSMPIETCKWCAECSPEFSWSSGKQEIEEWHINTYKNSVL